MSNRHLINSASYLSVAIAAVLLFVKSYGWLRTDSHSIFASLIDSMLDISCSVVSLLALRVSFLPPNDKRRFGHDKFQDLVVFAQAIFFLAFCMFILFDSIKALISFDRVKNSMLGAGTMYISVILTFILFVYQSYVVYRTKSKLIAVDRLHYFSDLITNLVVLCTLHISPDYWYVDSVAGICIALYIAKSSYKILLQAIKNLVDEEFTTEDKAKLISIIASHKSTKAIHELKTRYAGNKPFIQFHLELDPNLSLRKAHEISEELVRNIQKGFPLAEIIIHQDIEGEESDVQYRESLK